MHHAHKPPEMLEWEKDFGPGDRRLVAYVVQEQPSEHAPFVARIRPGPDAGRDRPTDVGP